MWKIILWVCISNISFSAASIWVVPPTSPTRHQLVSGIGIPLQLKEESITTGYLLKAQYYLAENVNHNKFNKFPGIFAPADPNFLQDQNFQRFPNGGRKRREILTDPLTGQQFESYLVNVEQIGDEPLNETKSDNWITKDYSYDDEEMFDDRFDDDWEDEEMKLGVNIDNRVHKPKEELNFLDHEINLPRWVIYDAISKYFTTKGLNGRQCLLRSICEASSTPFGENLFEELFHIFFTPSTTNEKITNSKDFDFFEAEQKGKTFTAQECAQIYPNCEKSLLEIVSDVEGNF